MRHSVRKPRRLDSRLNGLVVQTVLAVLVGLIVAFIFRQRTDPPAFWLSLLVSGTAAFMLLNFAVTNLLAPRPMGETVERDAAALTESITSSLVSSYAISSNWISLWRSPSFSYYLHLDTASSLIAYSMRFESPIARLSTDEKDQRQFFDEGWELVRQIAHGTAPLTKHRARFLIYPQWVYENYAPEINQLIRSHSAGRIPCIPLVSERLHRRLPEGEQRDLRKLCGQLGQTVIDKTPPRAAVSEHGVRLALRSKAMARVLGPIFPDVLLTDAQTEHDTAAAWWYTHSGNVNRTGRDEEQTRLAAQVFKAICQCARGTEWAGYVPSSLGGVAMVLTTDRLESEAFFSQAFYGAWLKWIASNCRTNDAARQLEGWMSAETDQLHALVKRDLNACDNGSSDSIALLDLGCGFGRHVIDLLSSCTGVDAMGVDINNGMIAQATRRAIQSDLGPRTSFFVDDVAALSDLSSYSVDVAICMTNTLGNLPPSKQAAMLRRLRAVLKPTGCALFSVYATSSVAARRASYEAVGLRVEERGNKLIAAQGLTSQAFTDDDLRNLLEGNGLQLNGPIRSVGIGLTAVARPSAAWDQTVR